MASGLKWFSSGAVKAVREPAGRALARLFRPALEAALENDSRNIARERQRIALRETAAFVDEHMANVRSYASGAQLLETALKLALPKPGLICEFGVYSGTSIRTIGKLAGARPVFGFDSFEGLPEDWFDGMPKGTFKVDALPKVPANVALVKGWFSDTLGPFLKEHAEPAAFLHVDCDLYSSTRTIFEAFEGRIGPGTVIAFDEYFNYVGWKQGEFKAFHELVARAGLKFEYIGYSRTREQVALRIV